VQCNAVNCPDSIFSRIYRRENNINLSFYLESHRKCRKLCRKRILCQPVPTVLRILKYWLADGLFITIWKKYGKTKTQQSNTRHFNPLNPELNPICYLLALLTHHFLHVSRIRVKSLTFRLLMSYIYIYIYIYITLVP
jgi:hypothetical protein